MIFYNTQEAKEPLPSTLSSLLHSICDVLALKRESSANLRRGQSDDAERRIDNGKSCNFMDLVCLDVRYHPF